VVPAAAELLQDADIPTLPEIFYRVEAAINNPYSNLSDIASILVGDAGLTARVLKVANSSLFSFPAHIDTVSQAISVVGTQQLRELVLSTYVMRAFEGVPAGLVDMDGFWRHSIACGIAARVIAAYRREANIERFYLLGLLHDVGRLILYVQRAEAAAQALQLSREQRRHLVDVESETIGIDHAEVGAALLENWRLPESLQEPVRHHHRPAGAGQYPDEAAVIHFADILANALQFGSSGVCIVPEADVDAWTRVGLPVSQLANVIENMERQYKDAVEIFTRDH
jgi:putative nucleotidyltransferase with HDIG domain